MIKTFKVHWLYYHSILSKNFKYQERGTRKPARYKLPVYAVPPPLPGPAE